MEISKLIDLSNLAKQQGLGLKLKRDLYEKVASHTDKTFLGILGPRGVGKTILLQQLHAVTESSLYISLDTLERDTDLFELIKELSETYKYKTFFLDELHFVNECNRYLKNIYDFLKVKVFFTSSASLKLIESAHDLSRRVKLITFHPFSFREFLRFHNHPCPPKLTFEHILQGSFTAEHSNATPYFKNYLSGSNYPFSLEVKDYMTALRNNVEKVIAADIPRLKSITFDELAIIKKMFVFIARSPVSDINASTLSHNLKITRYKALQYLSLLEEAFLIVQVHPAGTNVLKEPKVHMTLPYRLLESNYESAIGGLREDFAVQCFVAADIPFRYLKSTRGEKTPDFLITHNKKEYIVEIGGSGKTYKQFKGIDDARQKVIFSDTTAQKSHLPLALLGFLS